MACHRSSELEHRRCTVYSSSCYDVASFCRRSLQDAYGDPSYFKAIFADFYLGDLGIPFGHQNLRTIAIHAFSEKKHTHI
jgi:hypothetical protein